MDTHDTPRHPRVRDAHGDRDSHHPPRSTACHRPNRIRGGTGVTSNHPGTVVTVFRGKGSHRRLGTSRQTHDAGAAATGGEAQPRQLQPVADAGDDAAEEAHRQRQGRTWTRVWAPAMESEVASVICRTVVASPAPDSERILSRTFDTFRNREDAHDRPRE